MKKICILPLFFLLFLSACNDSKQDISADENNSKSQKIIRNIERKYSSSQPDSSTPEKLQFTTENLTVNAENVIISVGNNQDGIILSSSLINTSSIQDNNLFTRAIQTKNTAYCDLISEEMLKVQCLTVINDQKIIAEAIGKEDPTVCEQIVNPQTVSECKELSNNAIELATIGEEVRNNKNNTFQETKTPYIVSNKNWQVETLAMQKNEPALCSQIEGQEDRYECRYQVILLRAYDQNDPSICNLIGSEKWTGYCIENLNPR